MHEPPRIAALVMAAGLSARMAPRNKLLVRDRAGQAMVARVVQACDACAAACLYVVTGHQAGLVRDAVDAATVRKPLSFVAAPQYRQGLSASLAAGIGALPPWIEGALICLGDMPLVEAGVLDTVIRAFAAAGDRAVVVPRWAGRRGNPVLWARRYFPEIRALSGDAGARSLLDRYRDHVVAVEAFGPGVVTDFDTADAFWGTDWQAAPAPAP